MASIPTVSTVPRVRQDIYVDTAKRVNKTFDPQTRTNPGTCIPTRWRADLRELNRRFVLSRQRGTRALEGRPMLLSPGKKAVRVELHVGSRNVFVDAGFTEVDHFTLRRVVARIVFTMPRPVLTCNAMPWHMESIGLPSRVITTS